MILDHIGIAIKNMEQSKLFYTQALAPLGIASVMEIRGWAGFGRDKKPEFWFGEGEKPQNPLHLAFSARNRQEVTAFYEAAMAAGATCNGKPGLRPEYHPGYFGAFVIDPNGHNLEAVCHVPE